MGILEWFNKFGSGPDNGVGPKSFRLEWSGLATPPADGDSPDVAWTMVEALLGRFVAEPASSEAFFILGFAELSYIQAVWEEGSITLEYQDGSTDRHFVCIGNVDRRLVLEVARLYMHCPEAVGAFGGWEPMEM